MNIFIRTLHNKSGATAIIVALLIGVVFIGLAALAIDIGHLYVVKNELKNAADAGALAGANVLYSGAINQDGTRDVNQEANRVAFEAATANRSDNVTVDVDWQEGTNTGDVQRGHWKINEDGSGVFNPSDAATVNFTRTWDEINNDPNFVNAVRVVTRRQDTPAASFLARIFGHDSFEVTSSESIAYLGFAANSFGAPIAVCRQYIAPCTVGTMFPSTTDTAGWTNFSNPCRTANADEMKDLICTDGNDSKIPFGSEIGTVEGVQDVVYRKLRDCWRSRAEDRDGNNIPDKIWRLTLPVIECLNGNVGNCNRVIGAVQVDVLWMTDTGNDPHFNQAPRRMEDWPAPNATCTLSGQECWQSFVAHFNLIGVTYKQKTMYFRSECNPVPVSPEDPGWPPSAVLVR